MKCSAVILSFVGAIKLQKKELKKNKLQLNFIFFKRFEKLQLGQQMLLTKTINDKTQEIDCFIYFLRFNALVDVEVDGG